MLYPPSPSTNPPPSSPEFPRRRTRTGHRGPLKIAPAWPIANPGHLDSPTCHGSNEQGGNRPEKWGSGYDPHEHSKRKPREGSFVVSRAQNSPSPSSPPSLLLDIPGSESADSGSCASDMEMQSEIANGPCQARQPPQSPVTSRLSSPPPSPVSPVLLQPSPAS